MPSASYPVNIPDELRGDRVQVEVVPDEEEGGRDLGKIVAAMLSVFFLIVGAVMIGIGVGAWIHPGAGLAASGLVVVGVAVLLGFQV